ncbi:rod shape-determining protein MreC [Sediminibacillus dalangtanensis]|uniref:Cell shape-determining protein MreC n=1 Tax=Sediminibacillus dalangtanensis TaxID=2729421 RepID=A0ABX7VZP2_9BACI|nr:rod shape-determining protein MreC [Sediminibacillus dalangtanensis]QTM99957.1 rod shape-determining protein MreC [Sediminibacillus dalangtanensis]
MSFFRRTRLFIILIGFIVLVALIGFSLSDRSNLTVGEEFLKDTVGWLQGVVHRPAEFTSSIFSNIDEIKHTYEENQLLKERLADHKSLLYEIQELKQDNEELRQILDKTESISDYEPIQASVRSQSPEPFFKEVTINKGEQDGVKKNMAVITGQGMVGKIQSAAEFSSTVQLLRGFDGSNRISVTVSQEDKEDESGFIIGYDEEKEALMLKLNSYESEVEEGALVVSSGMGGVFIRGLEIGTVEEVTPDKYGLTQMAYVTPAADVDNMDHVIVVNAAEGNQQEEEE